jgi:hypothetical protein
MARSRIFHWLAWALLAAGSFAVAHADPLLVGVLEDIDARADRAGDPTMIGTHVRLAFEYRDGAWRPWDQRYPQQMDWTVVFGGRTLGSVSSHENPPMLFVGDLGIESITTGESHIPHVRVGASDFNYSLYKSRSRPLLLVSAPNYTDPDHWKPDQITAEERQLVISELRKRAPTTSRCDQAETGPMHHVSYSDGDVQLVKVYRSADGEAVVGVRLDEKHASCGFSGDEAHLSYWYVVKGGTVRFLDTNLVPIDAADLAGTGRSVWVFKTFKQEDFDGYELFYDDFSRKATFSWSWD